MTGENGNGVICMIPARGGSKRLPRKNVLPLGGRPLLTYAVRAALESGAFREVVVSTEDPEIAAAAERCGVRVHRRPDDLASDTARVPDVAVELLAAEEKAGRVYDSICTLTCTCPLITAGDLAQAHRAFLDSDASFLVSVVEAEPPAYIHLQQDPDGFLQPLFGPDYLKKRRQEMPKTYHPNGAIFTYRTGKIRAKLDICDEKTLAYVMPPERSVNIDTALDFEWAEHLIRKNQNIKETS